MLPVFDSFNGQLASSLYEWTACILVVRMDIEQKQHQRFVPSSNFLCERERTLAYWALGELWEAVFTYRMPTFTNIYFHSYRIFWTNWAFQLRKNRFRRVSEVEDFLSFVDMLFRIFNCVQNLFWKLECNPVLNFLWIIQNTDELANGVRHGIKLQKEISCKPLWVFIYR
jgi:hypothetical protein